MVMQLDDIALYVEVVKAKSFRGAAAALGIPNSTLSRRITALESAVGLRLLHRTTRKFEVTEVGQAYFDRCQRIINEARLAHEELGEYRTEPVGVLRISLPADFAITFLAPLIAEFGRLNPGIRLMRCSRASSGATHCCSTGALCSDPAPYQLASDCLESTIHWSTHHAA